MVAPGSVACGQCGSEMVVSTREAEGLAHMTALCARCGAGDRQFLTETACPDCGGPSWGGSGWCVDHVPGGRFGVS